MLALVVSNLALVSPAALTQLVQPPAQLPPSPDPQHVFVDPFSLDVNTHKVTSFGSVPGPNVPPSPEAAALEQDRLEQIITEVTGFSDSALSALFDHVTELRFARALEQADPDALVKDAFADGFTSAGLPRDPWLVGSILVCPGAKLDKSATSHDCGFCHVGEFWVWEHPKRIADEIRYLPGPRTRMQSVTLVVVDPGDSVDLVLARLKTGVHQLKEARHFDVTVDGLEHSSTRRPVHFKDRK